MSDLDFRPIVWVKGSRGCWRAGFTVGVQSFTVADERPTKGEAQFSAKMLVRMFENLRAFYGSEVKGPQTSLLPADDVRRMEAKAAEDRRFAREMTRVLKRRAQSSGKGGA